MCEEDGAGQGGGAALFESCKRAACAQRNIEVKRPLATVGRQACRVCEILGGARTGQRREGQVSTHLELVDQDGYRVELVGGIWRVRHGELCLWWGARAARRKKKKKKNTRKTTAFGGIIKKIKQ